MNYVERTITKVIKDTSRHFKIVLLTGMRQIGKTTVLKHLAGNNRKYVTFDDPDTLLRARTEPKLFFEENTPPFFLDEIQYAPEIFPYLKIMADNSNKNGIIWLSGSQQYHLMKNITESLAGRAAVIDLLGLSIYEREGLGTQQKPYKPSKKTVPVLPRRTAKETFEIIWRGSFPQIVFDQKISWARFYSSYLKTYLERDVRQLINIGNESKFVIFMKVIASLTGQELNMEKVSSKVGITVITMQNWLSILETSGIIYMLKPYFNGNIMKRFVKKPKVYFMDTGLCCFLSGWNTPKTLQNGAMSGYIFETFVISEIIKSYHHNGLFQDFYFYRESSGTEIDLLFFQNGKFIPIEIKETGNPKREDAGAFAKFAKIEPVDYGSVICLTKEPHLLTETANAVSIWDI